MSAEPKNPDAEIPPVGHAAYEESPQDQGESDNTLLSDLQNARKDRIAKIKADIEAGSYDSDELLEAALGRMLHNLPIDEEDLTEEESS